MATTSIPPIATTAEIPGAPAQPCTGPCAGGAPLRQAVLLEIDAIRSSGEHERAAEFSKFISGHDIPTTFERLDGYIWFSAEAQSKYEYAVTFLR